MSPPHKTPHVQAAGGGVSPNGASLRVLHGNKLVFSPNRWELEPLALGPACGQPWAQPLLLTSPPSRIKLDEAENRLKTTTNK